MNLESHPALHYIAVLLFYHIGLAANVLAGAHIVTQSGMNAVKSLKQYFALRWVPLFTRYSICLGLFLFVWENSSLGINLERFMPNLPAHLGVGILLGWSCDSVFDKALAILIPGMQKNLPPIPTDATQTSDPGNKP